VALTGLVTFLMLFGLAAAISALRLASPQGTRRGSEWQAFEAQQTEFP
jgi:hypothetical protein